MSIRAGRKSISLDPARFPFRTKENSKTSDGMVVDLRDIMGQRKHY